MTPAPTGRPEAQARPPRHLWDYWRVIWEGRRILVASLVLTTGIAALGTLSMPARYKAETQVEISLAQATVLGSATERGGARSFMDQDRDFKTEFIKIKTRDLIRTVITEHDLTTKVPDLGRTKEPVEVLRRCVSADRLSQTNVATISVVWTDPKEAALLANAVAQTYVDADLRERTRQLESRVERLQASVVDKTEVRRNALEQDLAVIAAEPSFETILSLSTMKDNLLLQKQWENLRLAETDASSVRGAFGSAHPDVRAKDAAAASIRGQFRATLAASVASMEEELVSVGGDPSTIQPSMAPVTYRQEEADDKLEQDLRERVSEYQILAQVAEPKAKIIDSALPPRQPFAPRWGLNLALATIVGLGFGGGLIFFRDYLDASVKTLDDIEHDLGLSLLAVVPQHAGELDVVAKEAFQTLRTGLLFASGGRKHRTLLITSGAPQEGKTSVVVSLARAMAGSGESVAVIDADLRRASLSRSLKIGRSKGLSNYLADASQRSWKELLVEVEPNLKVMPTGPVPPNPVDMLGLERFQDLLAQIEAAHDWVLIDSPPVSSVSDSVVLASHVKRVLVVMRHDRTDKEVMRRAIQRLRGVGATVVGAVLNGVDMTKSYNRDYYYGRFYYGHYYGDDAQKPKEELSREAGAISRIRKLLSK